MENEVAVAILYYKNPKSLLPTLNALIDIESKSRVWVINNGCKEEMIWPKQFEKFNFLNLNQNYGYAGGYNRALKNIFEHKNISVVLLLNPDAIIEKNKLQNLIFDYYNLKTQVSNLGLVQPLVLLPNRSINTSGNEMSYCGFSWTGRTVPVESKPTEINFVSGCATMMGKDVFEASGGFDEDYFAYYEDTELSLRLSLHGYQHFLVPSSTVIHHHDHSRNRKMWYFYERNRWKLILTYYPTLILIMFLPVWIYTEMISIIISIFKFDIRDKFASYIDNLKNIKQIYKKRRLAQKEISSKIFIQYLKRYTKTGINFQNNNKYNFVNKAANIPLIFWFKFISMMLK